MSLSTGFIKWWQVILKSSKVKNGKTVIRSNPPFMKMRKKLFQNLLKLTRSGVAGLNS